MIRKGFYCKWLSTLKLNEIAADVRSSMQQLDMWLARKAVVYFVRHLTNFRRPVLGCIDASDRAKTGEAKLPGLPADRDLACALELDLNDDLDDLRDVCAG